DIRQAEMQDLPLAAKTVSDGAMRELAVARNVAVKVCLAVATCPKAACFSVHLRWRGKVSGG
ncbi:MAG: hypothetical protein U1E02_02350, partial [Hydrogenophaga sp.]|nr:hypothetical protein [Hydrogenophaga sp.]